MADRDLTEKPIGSALFALSAPMSIGVLSIMLVGLADSYFLGQVGEPELAAIGFVYPVMIALTSIGIGLSAGANSVISRALGANEETDAARLSSHSIGYAVIVGISIACVLVVIHEPLLRLMGAKGAVLSAAVAYFKWWIASFPFLLASMSANAVMRAHGSAAWPAALMSVQASINVALTPLFVFGIEGHIPGFGAAGAGFATFAARVIESAIALVVIVFVVKSVKPSCLTFSGAFSSLKQITAVAAPAAGTNAINPAGMAIVTAAVATLGDAAVAGFGAATRIQSFALVPLLALSGGIGPVIGQNWGAEKFDRAKKAVSFAWIFALGYGLLTAMVLIFFATDITAILAPTDASKSAGAQYLQIVGWSLFGYGMLVITNAALNARGRPLFGLATSLTRVALVYVPAAWAGATLFGLTGVLLAAVAANLVGAVGSIYSARRTGLFDFAALPTGNSKEQTRAAA